MVKVQGIDYQTNIKINKKAAKSFTYDSDYTVDEVNNYFNWLTQRLYDKLRKQEYFQKNKAAYRDRLIKYFKGRTEQTPKWSDIDEMNNIYQLAKEKGLEVDHIVPITHPKVCGLHTQDNLRCIPKQLNRSKRNRYWADMWNKPNPLFV